MKLRKLYENNEALAELAKCKLPALTAYRLSKFMKLVAEEVATFEEVRVAKVKQYGKPDPKSETGEYLFEPKEGKKYIKEVNELLDQEVEISVPSILIQDFGDEKVPSLVFSQLDWLIKEK